MLWKVCRRPILRGARAPARARPWPTSTLVITLLVGVARASATEPPAEPESQPVVLLLEGQVTDALGAGLEDVTVTVHRETDGGGKGEQIASVATDRYGDFRVTASRPLVGEFLVSFSKPNHADLVRHVQLGEDEAPPFLGEQLDGNLSVAGWITDAVSERPIPGAAVRLNSGYRDFAAVAGEDGRFEVKGLSPGPASLVVEAEGFGREIRPLQSVENTGMVSIALKPERVVHLRIEDDNGKSISGVTVEIYDKPRDDFRTVVSDTDGALTIRHLHFDATALSLRLTHDEHVSSEDFDREMSIPPSELESAHRLVMTRAGSITGTVSDAASGRPLDGARVCTELRSSTASPRDWTDDQGSYGIRGVRPGDVVVTVHRSDYAPELRQVSVEPGRAATLDFTLRAGAVLHGLLRNEEGKPVSGLEVETGTWRGHATLDLRAQADREGRFSIHDAPYDEFEIGVVVRGAPPTRKLVRAGSEQPVEFVVAQPLGSPRTGEAAPQVSVTTLDGKVLDLAQLHGKTILLDFWATWCGPCVAELPELKAVHAKYESRQDFLMVGVSLDADQQTLRDFLTKRGVVWPQVFGEEGGADKAAERFGVLGLPALFLIGPDGRIMASDFHGAAIPETVSAALSDGQSP